jgi:hypothetical protein
MIYIFLFVQLILFFFMILHDWIEIKPLTNLSDLRKRNSFKKRLIGSIINGSLVAIPLLITWVYTSSSVPLWASLVFVAIYGFITFGTITAWWIPYFGGDYLVSWNQADAKAYKNTHSFLPKRGKNVVPNTLHCILHAQVWICFAFSLILLFTNG